MQGRQLFAIRQMVRRLLRAAHNPSEKNGDQVYTGASCRPASDSAAHSWSCSVPWIERPLPELSAALRRAPSAHQLAADRRSAARWGNLSCAEAANRSVCSAGQEQRLARGAAPSKHRDPAGSGGRR